MPDGLYLSFLKSMCEPESFHGSYSTGVSSDKFSILKLSLMEKRMERVCIEEVGVDPEHLCSCPWIRCRPYHGGFS